MAAASTVAPIRASNKRVVRPDDRAGPAPDPGPIDELDLLEPDFDDLDICERQEWVSAAPFRAHVRHLIEEYGLAWRTIAVLAEVPTPALRDLVRGRDGRPVPRLHPLIAERLFHLTADAIEAAASRPAHAGFARSLLHVLQHRGWTITEIIERSGLPGDEVSAVAAGARIDCSQLTEATIKAVAQALWQLTPPGAERGRSRQRSTPAAA